MKNAILLAILGLLASPSWGAVAFLNTNTAAFSNTGGPLLSTNMDVTATGSNRACFAVFAWDGALSSDNIASVTYGGQAMTSCGASASNPGGAFKFVKWFYLVNPPTGTNTLAATVTAADEIYGNLICFTGVDQTTPVRPGTYQNTTNAAIAANAATLTITSNANDISVSGITEAEGTTGTNQTNTTTQTSGNLELFADRATTPASSVAHTWSYSASGGSYAMVGFSIQEVQAAATLGSVTSVTGTGSVSTVTGTGSITFR